MVYILHTGDDEAYIEKYPKKIKSNSCLFLIKEVILKAIKALVSLMILISTNVKAFDYSDDPELFSQQLMEQHQMSSEQTEKWLSKATVQQSIIDAMNRPAEGKPWYQYRDIFLTQKRIDEGVKFWEKHQKTLSLAEKKYGVPAQLIVAIIGVETFYGKNKGSYSVLDALYTLGFHYPQRGQFFRNELAQYFLLAQQQKWQPDIAKGSYAGAMGYGQFIPSSYLEYAVDFDGDGHIDLINNPVDAIGSVANYFAKHGWQKDQPVIVDAHINNWQASRLASRRTELSYSLDELSKKGVFTSASLDPETKVSLLMFEQPKKHQYQMGLHNFYVISRYNHSPLYSLAAFQLSEEINQANKQSIIGAKGR